MQCEQIEGFLEDYASGQLPNYKVAWTAQHLAGCQPCRERLEAVRARRGAGLVQPLDPAPVAATLESVGRIRAPRRGALRRRRSRWPRRLVALGFLGALGLALWYLVVYTHIGR